MEDTKSLNASGFGKTLSFKRSLLNGFVYHLFVTLNESMNELCSEVRFFESTGYIGKRIVVFGSVFRSMFFSEWNHSS
jgi:hypothetical protein